MSRPVQPRTPSEHLVTLSRISRAIEIDTKRYSKLRRGRILRLIALLMQELQKEISGP